MKLIKAFSLIELMVVIAIVAVLAAVAVPSYKSYMARAKIANVIGASAELQAYVVDYYNKNGVLPPDTAWVTIPGVVHAHFWNRTINKIETYFFSSALSATTVSVPTDYKILWLIPDFNDANATVTWSCASIGNGWLDARIKCDDLPPACRTGCV